MNSPVPLAHEFRQVACAVFAEYVPRPQCLDAPLPVVERLLVCHGGSGFVSEKVFAERKHQLVKNPLA